MRIENNVFCPECGPDVRIDEEGWCVFCGGTAIGRSVDTLARRLRALELAVEAAREAADLLGIIASYVESDDDAGIGQIKWARDARRVETTLRAAMETK